MKLVLWDSLGNLNCETYSDVFFIRFLQPQKRATKDGRKYCCLSLSGDHDLGKDQGSAERLRRRSCLTGAWSRASGGDTHPGRFDLSGSPGRRNGGPWAPSAQHVSSAGPRRASPPCLGLTCAFLLLRPQVVERRRTPAEIREEFERLQREREERRLQQRTNPKVSGARPDGDGRRAVTGDKPNPVVLPEAEETSQAHRPARTLRMWRAVRGQCQGGQPPGARRGSRRPRASQGEAGGRGPFQAALSRACAAPCWASSATSASRRGSGRRSALTRASPQQSSSHIIQSHSRV